MSMSDDRKNIIQGASLPCVRAGRADNLAAVLAEIRPGNLRTGPRAARRGAAGRGAAMKTTIQIDGGDVMEVIEVHAEPTSVPGLVATFRDWEPGAPDHAWSLIHRRSGISVVPLRFGSYEDALDAATVFEDVDMTRPAADIAADARVMERVRFLWAYFPLLRMAGAVAATADHYVDVIAEEA